MNYREMGHESLSAFVKTVQQTVTNNEFDYLMAASDSGNLSAYITEEIYKGINKKCPSKFIVPIFRHVDKKILFDNTVQRGNYREFENRNFGDALFVDDEIWKGNTLNGTLDVAFSLGIQFASLTIIAEDGGFKPEPVMRGVKTNYISPKARVKDVYNAFSYIIPDEYQTPLQQLDPALNEKQIMCTLLGLPIKAHEDSKPYFSYGILEAAENNLSNFNELQIGFKSWFNGTIRNYMNI